MVSFDEQAILDNGAYIYNQRAEIERIADEICEKGFDSIFFTSSGGSLAMMQPFDYMVSVMSDIPVQSQVSADFLTVGNRRIGKGTLAFMASKSGDTKETVAAAKAASYSFAYARSMRASRMLFLSPSSAWWLVIASPIG